MSLTFVASLNFAKVYEFALQKINTVRQLPGKG